VNQKEEVADRNLIDLRMEDVRGRTILAAVDESEESMYALKWALDIFVSIQPTHSSCAIPSAFPSLMTDLEPELVLGYHSIHSIK